MGEWMNKSTMQINTHWSLETAFKQKKKWLKGKYTLMVYIQTERQAYKLTDWFKLSWFIATFKHNVNEP